MNIYNRILKKCRTKKQVVVLIDPDKQTSQSTKDIVQQAILAEVDYIFVGGSLVSTNTSTTIETIKQHTDIPVVLFPGSIIQLSDKADAILLLSLISGRNPELLIGNHVQAAPFLKKSGIEVIPTGYVLIDGGTRTSVEYMSGTMPIPANKHDIAVATAIAGEMLGHKLIYLEAGSGAKSPVCGELIKKVRQNISIPIIVGGGIRTRQGIENAFEAGADIVVVGTVLEENPHIFKNLLKK